MFGFYYKLRKKVQNIQKEGVSQHLVFPQKIIPNYAEENIKKYFDDNFRNEADSFLTENCVCFVNSDFNNCGEVIFFSITAIVTPSQKSICEANEDDLWTYIRYDYDLIGQKDFSTHLVPHMHVVSQKNGFPVNSMIRFPTFEPTEYLVFNIIDSIHKMANPQDWWEKRIEFMAYYNTKVTLQINDFVKDNGGCLGEVILRDEEEENRKNFQQWFSDYKSNMIALQNYPEYFEIPLDSRYKAVYGLYNSAFEMV